MRRGFCEAYVPTQQAEAREDPRFPRAHANACRTRGAQGASGQGPPSVDGVTVVPGRVESRRQFARFSSPTSRGSSGPIRVVVVSDGDELQPVRVAYAIGRSVGSAVIRNRVRRRLRSLFDSLEPAPRPGLYLVKCGIETGRLSFDELHQHLRRALDRAGVL